MTRSCAASRREMASTAAATAASCLAIPSSWTAGRLGSRSSAVGDGTTALVSFFVADDLSLRGSDARSDSCRRMAFWRSLRVRRAVSAFFVDTMTRDEENGVGLALRFGGDEVAVALRRRWGSVDDIRGNKAVDLTVRGKDRTCFFLSWPLWARPTWTSSAGGVWDFKQYTATTTARLFMPLPPASTNGVG
nr:hypothetical protein [Pandoravirus belohorizontensis]